MGPSDIFVVKYSSSGAYMWDKTFGSASSQDAAAAVAVDGSDNIILTGGFQNTVDLGGGPLTSAGNSDIFLAKYAANGTHVWSRRAGGTGNDTSTALALDTRARRTSVAGR